MGQSQLKMHSEFILLFASVSLFHVGCGHGINDRRFARGIRGTYTSTVVDTSVVTSLVPSSCVQVDATLPPCRSVRFLRFPYFSSNKQPLSDNNSKEDNSAQTESDPLIKFTPLAWGEYFGLYAPTVTVTLTKFETTVMQDPRVVVTYAVKGCKPMKIPNDLDRCPQESSTIAIQDILPTSTVTPHSVSQTASPVENQVHEKESIVVDEPTKVSFHNLTNITPAGQLPNHEVESSNDNVADNLEPTKPTEALPF